jgi:hypothetical protein
MTFHRYGTMDSAMSHVNLSNSYRHSGRERRGGICDVLQVTRAIRVATVEGMPMKLRPRPSVATVSILAANVLIAACVVVLTSPLANAEPAATTTHPTTALPSQYTEDVLVDDVHERVFISMRTANSVAVTDLNGTLVETITGITDAGTMAFNADGSALYVTESSARSIARINAETLAVEHIAMPDGVCPRSLTFTGGKVWFSHEVWSTCGSLPGLHGLGVLDPATGQVTLHPANFPRFAYLNALPDRPDRLIAQDPYRYLGVLDVTGEAPVVVAEKSGSGAPYLCRDTALTSGGDRVVVACASTPNHQVYNTADLSLVGSIRSHDEPVSVALTPDNTHVAAAVSNHPGCGVYVWNIANGIPGSFVSSYEVDGNVRPHNLAYSSTGRVFAVTGTSSDTSVLHVLSGPSTCRTTMSLTSFTTSVKYGSGIHGQGNLNHTLTRSGTIRVFRTDRTGIYDVGTFPVYTDGEFLFHDYVEITGPVTYDVIYEGDEIYGKGSLTVTARIRPRPFDVNADTAGEVVVGAPGEDLGSVSNAGSFHLLYRGYPEGSIAISQSTPGVPGTSETGDGFGYANAAGDFNGDGYADVAVSARGEDLGDVTDAGALWIFAGSANGLRTDNVATLTLDDTPRRGTRYARFGTALASGDFNRDGFEDLAIGAPGADEVFIAMGSETGLSGANLRSIHEDSYGIPGTRHAGERFAWSLSAADVDLDRSDDLAIGAPYDYDDLGYPTGAVTILYGGYDGPIYRPQRFTKNTQGVPGAPSRFDGDKPDQFGHQVKLAPFDANGGADLAVGAPGSALTVDGVRKADAGTVTVLYTNGPQIGTSVAVQITQSSSGIPGTPGARDEFGTTLAAGDTAWDAGDELAIYSPGDNYVTVIPGTSAGLSSSGVRGLTQDSLDATTEPGDRWGASLRFLDVDGYHYEALLVGAPGEDSGAGALTEIPSWKGLSNLGRVCSQNTDGIPGTKEAGDGFGSFF